ncbi:hypothetical protein, partial [Dialister succinatiphilus]|uniref:hypothetical protein n=1 Tax=Dialister succinatiphilus TaxID=487173 RepID=UPI004029F105
RYENILSKIHLHKIFYTTHGFGPQVLSVSIVYHLFSIIFGNTHNLDIVKLYRIRTPQKHGTLCRDLPCIEGRHESGISALAKKIGDRGLPCIP